MTAHILILALLQALPGVTAVSNAFLTKYCADPKGADKPLFTFVQITDTHCLTTEAPRNKPSYDPSKKLLFVKLNHWRDFANSFEILEDTIRYINKSIQPDFLIHTGDITDQGSTTDLKKSKKILEKLKCPYHACQGDHEVRKTGGVYHYVKVFKKRCRSFDVKGWHFIMMGIFPTEKELKWLEKDLAGNRKKHVVFFTHRLVVSGPLVTTGFEAYGVEGLMPRAERVLELLKGHGGAVLVLSGHVHMNLHYRKLERGVIYTAFMSTDALVEPPHQFKVFQVYKNHVEVVLYSGLSADNIKKGDWTHETISVPGFLKYALAKKE